MGLHELKLAIELAMVLICVLILMTLVRLNRELKSSPWQQLRECLHMNSFVFHSDQTKITSCYNCGHTEASAYQDGS